VLVIICRWRHGGAGTRGRIRFPRSVAGAEALIAAQSLIAVPRTVRANLIDLGTVLLASAAFALGVATRWHQLKTSGTRPLLLATSHFCGPGFRRMGAHAALVVRTRLEEGRLPGRVL
jgi:uncharacterized membrane protein YadS